MFGIKETGKCVGGASDSSLPNSFTCNGKGEGNDRFSMTVFNITERIGKFLFLLSMIKVHPSAPEINISPVPDIVSGSRRFVPVTRSSYRSQFDTITLKEYNPNLKKRTANTMFYITATKVLLLWITTYVPNNPVFRCMHLYAKQPNS